MKGNWEEGKEKLMREGAVVVAVEGKGRNNVAELVPRVIVMLCWKWLCGAEGQRKRDRERDRHLRKQAGKERGYELNTKTLIVFIHTYTRIHKYKEKKTHPHTHISKYRGSGMQDLYIQFNLCWRRPWTPSLAVMLMRV